MKISRLNSYTTEELLEELKHREDHPEWFIRDLVKEGYELEGEAWEAATNWIDDDIARYEE